MTRSAPHFQVGGAVKAGALYVERRADRELVEALLAAEFCHILAPRQIGKSSMRIRAARALKRKGVRCVSIDFSGLGSTSVSQDDWYFSIAYEIAAGLDLPDPEAFWREHGQLSPVHRWYRFLRNALLAAVEEQVVIFIDEVDSILALSFATDDFFASVRAAYNLRADDEAYGRLTFCLLGVAAPTDLIKNPVRTPFNIGKEIRVEDFSRAELDAFAEGLFELGRDTKRLLDAVFAWTCGHPYMTQRLCEELRRLGRFDDRSEASRVDEVAHALFIRSGRAGDANLSYAEKRLEMNSSRARVRQLLHLYRRLLDGERVPAQPQNPLQAELRLMGIAAEDRDEGEPFLRTRNLIFAEVYDHSWLKEKEKQYRLVEAVERWSTSGKNDDYVLRGHALEDALEWSRGRNDLTLPEHEYLLAGVELARREAEARSKTAEALARQEESRRALIEEKQRTVEERFRGDLERERRERAEDSANSQRRLISLLSVVVLGLGAIVVSIGTRGVTVSQLRTQLARESAEKSRQIRALKIEQRASDVLINAREPGLEVEALVLAIREVNRYERSGRLPPGRLMRGLVAAVASPPPDPVILEHPAAVSAARFSTDGTLVLTGADDGSLRLWDTTSGQLLESTRAHKRRVLSVMFMPDPRQALTVGDDGTARLWDLNVGTESARLTGLPRDLRGALLTPRGDRLLTLGDRSEPQLWDVPRRRRVATLHHPRGAVQDAAISSQSGAIATGHEDGALRLWEPRSGQLVAVRSAGATIVRALFGPGDQLATSHVDGVIRLWSAERLEARAALEGHVAPARELVFSGDGSHLISVDDAGGARLWRVTDGATVASLSSHGDKVRGAAFSDDSARLVTRGEDGSARVWRTTTGELVSILVGHNNTVRSARFSPGAHRVVTASDDGTARLWSPSGGLVAAFTGHQGPVADAVFSPDGGRVLTIGARDHTARLWSASSVSPIPTLVGHDGPVRRAVFSPDGARLITGGEDRLVVVWDADTNRRIERITGHRGPIADVVFPLDAPDRFLTLAEDDPTARVHRLSTGSAMATLTAGAPMAAAAFSADGREVTGVDARGEVARRDISTGEPRPGCHVGVARITAAAFSADGDQLVVAGREPNALELYDAATCERSAALTGHEGAVLKVRFSDEARLIVAVTSDRMAHLWSSEGRHLNEYALVGDTVLDATVAPGEGRLLLTGLRGASVWRATAPFDRLWQLDGQPGPVLAATFGDKGSTIATIGGDSSARIWGPPAPPEADNALHELLGGEPSDPNAYELRATFRGHRSTINAIAFSPRDMQLVVADRNGVIRVYPLDIAVYRQLACRLLHGFTEAYREVEAFCRS